MRAMFRYPVSDHRDTACHMTELDIAVNCWPTPSNDGTCEVNIEYELDNDKLVLHDVVISIPLP